MIHGLAGIDRPSQRTTPALPLTIRRTSTELISEARSPAAVDTDDEWAEHLFDEVFTMMLAKLAQRREVDPTVTIRMLEAELSTQYVCEGNDWGGRGPVYRARQSAVIAAYEEFLARWRDEAAGEP
jgi:hypothetical protein